MARAAAALRCGPVELRHRDQVAHRVVAQPPPAIVERLAREIAAVLALPEIAAQLAKLGAEPVGSTPVQFAAFMQSENQRWGKIIRERGIKPE